MRRSSWYSYSRARMGPTVLLVAALLAGTTQCPKPAVRSRGVDSRVDYEALKAIGPWDDRNYQLTSADLELLAPNEAELRDPIPAFFRVLLRKNNPTLCREGPAQYPRSAVQIFLQECGGYLVDGKLYDRVRLERGRYVVVQENGVDYAAPTPADSNDRERPQGSRCQGP